MNESSEAVCRLCTVDAENLLRKKCLHRLRKFVTNLTDAGLVSINDLFHIFLIGMNSLIDSPVQRTAQTQDAASGTENARKAELRATRIRTAHRFAGMTLALFIAMHLTNHLFALFSVERHVAVMDILRLIYRNPLGEVILLAAVLVQVPSGILLVKRKGWRGLPLAERAQVASGGYLAFFLVAHVFAVMMGRHFFYLDTNFYFASAPLLSFLWAYYVVYYGLSVVAVFTHVASIHYQKMLSLTSPQRARIQALVIGGVGLVVAVLILLAFSGVVYEITLPAAYKWW